MPWHFVLTLLPCADRKSADEDEPGCNEPSASILAHWKSPLFLTCRWSDY